MPGVSSGSKARASLSEAVFRFKKQEQEREIMQQQKKKIRSRYVKLGLTIFLAGAGLLMCYYLLYNTADVKGVFSKINGILTPFSLGIIMAYLLCPIYNGTLRIVYRRSRGRLGSYTKDYRLARVIATIVSFAVLMVVLIGFFMLVIPELTRSIVGLVSDVPIYVENAINWIEKTAVENPDLANLLEGRLESASQSFLEWGQNNVLPGAEAILTKVSMGILGTFGVMIDFLVSLIICIYVLNSKEIFLAQAKKFILAVFSRDRAAKIFEFGELCNNTFGGFINGKIIDSIIIGIICFIAMTVLGLPLTVLISVVVGITNVIPFFGPFIGAIPSIILLLFIDPWAAVKFAVMILVLQQLDGNVIGPKILGKTTKLASFWVMFAIIVGGGLFGFAGMILGVPTMAILYIYISRIVNNRLAGKDLSNKTQVYENFEKYKIDKEDIFGKDSCGPITKIEERNGEG